MKFVSFIFTLFLLFSISARSQQTSKLQQLIQQYVHAEGILIDHTSISLSTHENRGEVYFNMGYGLRDLRKSIYPQIYFEAMSTLSESDFLNFIQSEKSEGRVLGRLSDLLYYHDFSQIDLLIERTYENGPGSRAFLLSQFTYSEEVNDLLRYYGEAVAERAYEPERVERFNKYLDWMAADYEALRIRNAEKGSGQRFVSPARIGFENHLKFSCHRYFGA